METWFIILVSICVSALIKSTINLLFTTKKPSYNLPPSPSSFPIIGNFVWLRKSSFELEHSLRSIHAKLGPIVTLWIGFRPTIFIADRSLAHQALIQNGAVFATRPKLPFSNRSSSITISSSLYGPTWRLLRRNLTSEILHPSRIKSYSNARNWVLKILFENFKSQYKSGDPIYVLKEFQYASFCLLVLMCFGDKLESDQIKRIEEVHRNLLLNLSRFRILNMLPSVTKIIFRKRWKESLQVRRQQEEVLMPLIRARRDIKQEKDGYVLAYVDTLFDLQLPEENNRKLKEEEMVTLCSEFISAGTDSTSTALQWIMANLVKDQAIQAKVYREIKEVVGEEAEMVKEDDLQKMPYLKAVVLEGLRRHPPGHFVVPHAVKDDMVLNGYLVPKKGVLNFMVADMGWDSTVWEDPLAFKPERFMNDDGRRGEGFDITGSREIKMMPFGVGRRICPGLALAMLHLEYFVANLVWKFQWTAVDGEDVDLSEKLEATIMMKHPLKAHITPRFD